MTLTKILIPGKMSGDASLAAGMCGYSGEFTYLFLKAPFHNRKVCLYMGELFCSSWQDKWGGRPFFPSFLVLNL